MRPKTHSDFITLVYTMGKVGSTTIFETLRKEVSWHFTFSIHFLSDKFLYEYLPRMNPQIAGGFEKGFAIRDTIAAHPEKRLKIITLVRDPIMRDFSDIFQKWGFYFQDKRAEEVQVEEIISIISKEKHLHPLNWFDNEFKRYLNFDIYDFPFDKEKGYSIYEQEGFDLLCIQLEKLDTCWREAILRFIGKDIPTFERGNTRKATDKFSLYQAAREAYQISGRKRRKVYHSKFVKHFYSEDMIEQFIAQWSPPGRKSKRRIDTWLSKCKIR